MSPEMSGAAGSWPGRAFAATAPASPPPQGAEGEVALTDSDLCGILSGELTDWNESLAANGPEASTISVAYPSDKSGPISLLPSHSASFCIAANCNTSVSL